MPETQPRREREVDLIRRKCSESKFLADTDTLLLLNALEAAHKREDAIRKLSRKLDEELVPSGRAFARRIDAILDAD